MATAAGDFLSLHLAIIVRALNIGESLAGVTIFAFGNGSSDLFSTLAAMDSSSGSLAISELFGAAAFITTVVLGLIMVARPFSVDPHTFIGDVSWFFVAAALLMIFVADGYLALSECLCIIGLYVMFVFYAILRPSSFATQAHDIQDLEDHGELHESNVDYPDESTPILATGSSKTRAEVTFTGDGPSIVTDMLSESSTETELISSDSSIALVTSRTELEDTHAKQRVLKCALGLIPGLSTWKNQNIGGKVLSVFSIPLLVPIGLTTPVAPIGCLENPATQNFTEPCEEDSARIGSFSQCTTDRDLADHKRPSFEPKSLMKQWLVCAPLLVGPQFVGLTILQQSGLFDFAILTFLPVCLVCATLSAGLIFCFLRTNQRASNGPGLGDFTTSIFGFIASMTWIYLTASSAVSVLITLGIVFNISDAVLGASIFAIGNSSNDLVANIAVARRGAPVLAASACLGGPMMNMLLGIGGGGLIQYLKHSGQNRQLFRVSPTLFVSGAALLLGLAMTLGYSFYNSWKLDRMLGLTLVGFWVVTTTGIVATSMVEL